MDERDRKDLNDVADEPLHSDEGDLTPPQGDELRSEETFGRTDRYSNVDDADATREERLRNRRPRSGQHANGASGQ